MLNIIPCFREEDEYNKVTHHKLQKLNKKVNNKGKFIEIVSVTEMV